MIKFYLSVLLLFAASIGFSQAQFTIELIGMTENVDPGMDVTVDFKVKGFNAINNMSWSVAWDETNLQYKSVALNSVIDGLTEINSAETVDGLLGFTFSPVFWPGPSINDFQVLFSITFQAIGFNGTVTEIELSELPVGLSVTGREVMTGEIIMNVNGVVNIGSVGVRENGADKSKLALDVTVYPIPTNGVLFINHDNYKGESIAVKVLDLTGELQMQTTLNEQRMRLDLTQLAAGIYFLSLESAHEVVTKRVVIK